MNNFNWWYEFQQNFIEFSDKTFGEQTPNAKLLHMKEELMEVLDEQDDHAEWADVMILFLDAARKSPFNLKSITSPIPSRVPDPKTLGEGVEQMISIIDRIIKSELKDATAWNLLWITYWICLFRNRIDEAQLLKACEDKFEVLKNRDWGKPDEHGVVRHVKGDGSRELTDKDLAIIIQFRSMNFSWESIAKKLGVDLEKVLLFYVGHTEQTSQEAKALLLEWGMMHDAECRSDHKGYCQEHFIELVDECLAKRTKQFINKY